MKILVVDDNPTNLRLIRMVMKTRSVELVEAVDGPEALAKALAERPDVILMDIQLPRMSGLEVMEKLQGEPNFPRTPVIAFTAHAMQGDREKFLAAGFAGYITKPINTRTVFDEIQEIQTKWR